jgi:hypothetical protein
MVEANWERPVDAPLAGVFAVVVATAVVVGPLAIRVGLPACRM